MNNITVHFPRGNVQILGFGGGSSTQRSLVSLRHSQFGARRSFPLHGGLSLQSYSTGESSFRIQQQR